MRKIVFEVFFYYLLDQFQVWAVFCFFFGGVVGVWGVSDDNKMLMPSWMGCVKEGRTSAEILEILESGKHIRITLLTHFRFWGDNIDTGLHTTSFIYSYVLKCIQLDPITKHTMTILFVFLFSKKLYKPNCFGAYVAEKKNQLLTKTELVSPDWIFCYAICVSFL